MTKLTDFVFTDTGISVKIRKVSPMLVADIEASIPHPQPPEQIVDYGEPKGKVKEKNLSDPVYLAAMNERVTLVYQAWRTALIRRGVVLEGEDWKQEVAEYRQFIQDQTGHPLDEPDDRLVYILRICIGTIEDQDELINAITRRSQPTEAAIEEAKASFPGQV